MGNVASNLLKTIKKSAKANPIAKMSDCLFS